MKKLTALLASIAFASMGYTQDVKFMEQRDLLASEKVASVQTVEIRFKGDEAIDSIPKGKAEFDDHGRMIRYTEFFARGRKAAEFIYEYDDKGRLVSSSVSHRAMEFRPIPMKMEMDDQGRMISRAPAETIPGMWEKETFSYDRNGGLVRADQWYSNGQHTFDEYPAQMMPGASHMSMLMAPNGLIHAQQRYDGQRQLTGILRYRYTKRP
jgi:hypothetical protein